MNVLTIFEYLGNGGIMLFLLLMGIEWAPVKVNPIQWLGTRFNKKATEDTEKFRNDITESVNKINDKLDAHIAESYRNSILNTQGRLLDGKKFTFEEWSKILETCQDYEEYIKKNKLRNGQVVQAIKFIEARYQKCLNDNDFIGLPNN